MIAEYVWFWIGWICGAFVLWATLTFVDRR